MTSVHQLPNLNRQSSTTGCCPVFNPAEWDGKTFEFDQKKFVKATTRSLFHIPLNMGSVISRTYKLIEQAGAQTDEFVMLSLDISPWKAEHYLAVTKDVPGLEIAELTGTFQAKVYEGPFQKVPEWCQDFTSTLKGEGKKAKKLYFYYTTCPKCAKTYGKNYVVAFAQLD